jgi:hypothetical protein
MPDISNLFIRIWAFIQKLFIVAEPEVKVVIKAKTKSSCKPCASKRKLTKKK